MLFVVLFLCSRPGSGRNVCTGDCAGTCFLSISGHGCNIGSECARSIQYRGAGGVPVRRPLVAQHRLLERPFAGPLWEGVPDFCTPLSGDTARAGRRTRISGTMPYLRYDQVQASLRFGRSSGSGGCRCYVFITPSHDEGGRTGGILGVGPLCFIALVGGCGRNEPLVVCL